MATDTTKTGIGLIGCGNISSAYLAAAPTFDNLDIRGVADLDPDAARARAEEFGVTALSVDDLLARDDISIIVNLTTPQAHVPVGIRVLEAGKHVYSEKPLAVTVEDGRALVDRGKALGLRVGCAPDTFLGGGHQTCRNMVDAGDIGEPIAGTAYFMCPGHERWHPNPAFYYHHGGGPMMDMGPYYITDLVNLLGPVAAVTGAVATPRKTRPILSEPLRGQQIEVEVPTHVSGTLEFAIGALVQISMSFDVVAHRHHHIELYGTEGSLLVPDPNQFGGTIEVNRDGKQWTSVEPDMPYHDGNHRIIGVADMAHAIAAGRPHRASGELALHVLEVMTAFERSSRAGQSVSIETRPERPAALRETIVDGVLG